MHEKKKNIAKLAIMSLFIIGIIIILFVYLQSTGNMIKTLSNKRMNIKTLEQDIKNLAGYRSELESLKSQSQFYGLKLPSQEEFTSILEDISRIAAANNVKIQIIEPRQPVFSEDFYLEIPIFLNARCGYHALGKFIDELEKADRIIKVTSIKISGSKSDPYNHEIIMMVSGFCTK
ncbi:MAG: type 4a pilus biogenesis protein PilO [Candidatus Omnitrophota bacterium]